ncbi:MAG TPA: hypothetical protein VEV16_01710 [Daejeonella sp.]|nr:hypothetical protein [Daejeonella sp.]
MKKPKFLNLNKPKEEEDLENSDQQEEEANDLAYNKEENSFEYDIVPEDEDYDHPDPYNTAVKNGGDFDSDYDESNPTAMDEYEVSTVENGLDEFGMRIAGENAIEVNAFDEELSKTPEDERSDLDEEGYPKNDQKESNGTGSDKEAL